MVQPQGFEVRGKENIVCKLQKSFYGLKQAPRQWYNKFDSFMGSNSFLRCQADYCCHVKNIGNFFIILLLYVDDMLIAGDSKQDIDKLKGELSKEFEIKDLGVAKQIPQYKNHKEQWGVETVTGRVCEEGAEQVQYE